MGGLDTMPEHNDHMTGGRALGQESLTNFIMPAVGSLSMAENFISKEARAGAGPALPTTRSSSAQPSSSNYLFGGPGQFHEDEHPLSDVQKLIDFNSAHNPRRESTTPHEMVPLAGLANGRDLSSLCGGGGSAMPFEDAGGDQRLGELSLDDIMFGDIDF